MKEITNTSMGHEIKMFPHDLKDYKKYKEQIQELLLKGMDNEITKEEVEIEIAKITSIGVMELLKEELHGIVIFDEEGKIYVNTKEKKIIGSIKSNIDELTMYLFLDEFMSGTDFNIFDEEYKPLITIVDVFGNMDFLFYKLLSRITESVKSTIEASFNKEEVNDEL